MTTMTNLPPSVTQPAPLSTLTAKYQFFDTRLILDEAHAAGFHVTQALSVKSRRKDPHAAKHMLRLRALDSRPVVGDVHPEIVLVNSHDGSTTLQFLAGLFRLVCSNGMIVSTAEFAPVIRVRHTLTGSAILQASLTATIEAAQTAAEAIPRLIGHSMTLPAQDAYAAKAAALLPTALDPSRLLVARRIDDTPENLWTIFNRVQENLMRGGILTRHSGRRIGVTRAVQSVSRTLSINTALWNLNTEFLQQG